MGLNYCLRSQTTTFNLDDQLHRFTRDLLIKLFFANRKDRDFNPRFHVKSNWLPPHNALPREFRLNIEQFTTHLRTIFNCRRTRSNLLRYHQTLLQHLQDSEVHLVIPSDKNLGPVIIERGCYIARALQDHLWNAQVYDNLSQEEANAALNKIRGSINFFLFSNRYLFSKQEYKFLSHSLVCDDPFSYFYLLAKIHKNPWQTRPIVSTSGSLLSGLGVWIDHHLQPLVCQLPSFVKDSASLVALLQLEEDLPPTAKLITADAVSMYTNIDIDHALQVLPSVLPSTHLGRALLAAIKILMTGNVFKFGDTFWQQKSGTAMGTPPAPPYAMLYFGAREAYLLERYRQYIIFY